ncbi:MarR family winged helix-turn-helix transcriptional regulator [Flaviaesturariibacter terrae]
MGIEQDIQQTRFVNARQKAMINLLYTYGWVMEQIKNFLAAEDITHQQFNILRILRGAMPQPLSTLQIRERMLDKMSDTSRIVDRLLAKELVQKSTCPKDKRLVDVTISPKGLALLQKLDKRTDPVQHIMRNLSDDEAEQLNEMLDRMRT